MQLQTSTSQSADQPGGETSNPLTKDASKDNKAEDAQAKLKGNSNSSQQGIISQEGYKRVRDFHLQNFHFFHSQNLENRLQI